MMSKSKFSTRTMVLIGILASVSFLLMQFEFPLPMFPPFLMIDASDLPSVIASLSMGPAAAVLIQFIKNVLKFIINSKTAGVGELANFFIGVLFVVPLGLVYRKLPNLKGYIIGVIAGTVSMSVFAAILNYTILIPFYATLFGGMEVIIHLCTAVNSNITDLKTIILFAIIPFNILKCFMISILGYFTYRALRLTPIFNMNHSNL